MRHTCQATSKGFSIPELMVSAFLFALILGGVVQVVIEGLRYFTMQSIALEVQQQSLIAMTWLSQDLADASPKSLRQETSPPGLIFASPRDLNGNLAVVDGAIAWQKFVCYYIAPIENRSTLVRKSQQFDDPALIAPPVPPEVTATSFMTDSTSGRVMAHHIKSINLSADSPAKLTLEADYDNGTFTMKIETEVRLRSDE